MHFAFQTKHVVFKNNKCNDGGNRIGDGLCRIDSPYTEKPGQNQCQRYQNEELAHNAKKKRILRIAHSNKSVLIDHLIPQAENCAEHEAKGRFCLGNQGGIGGKYPTNDLREKHNGKPHGNGAGYADAAGVADGVSHTLVILCAKIIADDGLCTADDSAKRHEEDLADAVQDRHNGKVQRCVSAAVNQDQTVQKNADQGLIYPECERGNAQGTGLADKP